MIEAMGRPSCAFSLIYLSSMNQIGHISYQMKAEHLSYLAVSFILSFIKMIKIYVLKSKQMLIFYLHFF